MQRLVRQIREDLLATEDTVCLDRARLVTEAWARYEDLPPSLRQANVFSHVLDHMVLDVQSNPVFAGNTSAKPRAWMLVPEYGIHAATQVELENESVRGLLDGAIPADLQYFWEKRAFGGNCAIGHLAVDLDRIVNCGLDDILAELDALAGQGSKEEQEYREAMALSLRSIIRWTGRYADAAELAARRETDPVRRACHWRVAEACRHVPARPARNLFEGLQSIALIQLALTIEGHGMSVSMGLLDRVLARFVVATFDVEAVADLVGAFLLKITANSVFGRGSKTQAITLGGADHTGRDGANEITLAFLAGWDRVRVGDPHLFLRWHDGLSEPVREKAIAMLAAGCSMPLLIHDAPTAAGFVRVGVAPEDAWDYCVVGCNELGIPGRSADSATAGCGTIQHLALLNRLLLDGDPERFQSMDDLLEEIEQHLCQSLRNSRRNGHANARKIAEQRPMPFTSALMQGCIPQGQDFRVGMPYHIAGHYERQISNAANVLAAIEQLVFLSQQHTLTELADALRANHADSALREQLLAQPQWGTDDERADRWAIRLLELRERILRDIDQELGEQHMVCHVVRSLHHLDGVRIDASLDGRFAHEPVADSIGAVPGTPVQSPTALLNSVAKIDAARFYGGGYNLNVTLPPGKDDEPAVRALVETFFAKGGQELQLNRLDPAVLRDAQIHPEQHGDLVVRFAGFSGRFVDLSPREQREMIARADNACQG
jgi:formate C-acetyltransferase